MGVGVEAVYIGRSELLTLSVALASALLFLLGGLTLCVGPWQLVVCFGPS